MKLFKNRGDIYISKTGTKADKEQTVLLILLAVILLFSIIFVVLTGAKNDFSAKKFFEPENTVSVAADETQQELPRVEGKTNYLFIITGRDEETLYMTSILQVDMDSISYKVCNFLPQTKLDGNAINAIYKNSGMNNLMQAIEKELSVDLDYYIIMNLSDFEKLFDLMGTVNYPLIKDIKFKDSSSADTYSVKFSAGEETLDGKKFVSLLRYFVNEQKDCKMANDLVLNGLSQLMNMENAAKKEDLFKEFIVLSKTNISIKDFSQRTDHITVLTDSRTGANAYNVETEYKGNVLTADSKSSIKSYFSK